MPKKRKVWQKSRNSVNKRIAKRKIALPQPDNALSTNAKSFPKLMMYSRLNNEDFPIR